jgi:hypothetical protein
LDWTEEEERRTKKPRPDRRLCCRLYLLVDDYIDS